MLLNCVFLIVGMVVLIYSAESMVNGSSALAARLNIPNMVIGLTIVAFGTSAPEFVVSIIASINGQSDLSFGNVIGSNIFNILGIIGVTAMICPIIIKRNTTRIEIPIIILAILLVLIMFGNNYWAIPQRFIISRIEGAILLACMISFVVYTIRLAKKGESEDTAIKSYTITKSVLLIIVGITGLVLGGRILVKGAVNIAETLGVSQRIIAITIVSVGTSLPELATSIVAARKKNVDMAIGNVVGSNLFNIFFVLGTSAVISPIILTQNSLMDILICLLASILIFFFVFVGKGRQISRWEGVLLLLMYTGYVIYLIFQ